MNDPTRRPDYAEPPAGGFGAAASAPFGAFGPMQTAYVGMKPTPRNAIVVGLLPFLFGFFGNMLINILAGVLEVPLLGLFGSLLQLGCIIAFFVNAMRALEDLRRATNNPAFPRWPIFIPFYNIAFFVTLVPMEVQKAKAQRGMQATSRAGVLYFFFPVFALQRDLNDLAQ